MRKREVCAILFFTFCFTPNVRAQDIHFSEFYLSPILNNPALTGVFNEDFKAGAMYRTQWNTVTVPFTTSLIDLETKVRVNEVNDYVSFGLLGYSDKAGSVGFQTNGVYPAVNYSKSLEDKYTSYISFGFTGGFIQRNMDISKMTFDEQYVNGNFDPSSSTGEQMLNNKISYWDLGTGITFNSSLDMDNKTNYFLGVAAYHFTQPKNSIFNDPNAHLSIRWVFNGGINYESDLGYGVQIYANIMVQKPYREIVTGALGKWTFEGHSNDPAFALYMGCFYRLNDALIPTMRVTYKKTTIGLTYDINNSSLETATQSQGGFEVSLFYTGSFINVTDQHLCPRF